MIINGIIWPALGKYEQTGKQRGHPKCRRDSFSNQKALQTKFLLQEKGDNIKPYYYHSVSFT